MHFQLWEKQGLEPGWGPLRWGRGSSAGGAKGAADAVTLNTKPQLSLPTTATWQESSPLSQNNTTVWPCTQRTAAPAADHPSRGWQRKNNASSTPAQLSLSICSAEEQRGKSITSQPQSSAMNFTDISLQSIVYWDTLWSRFIVWLRKIRTSLRMVRWTQYCTELVRPQIHSRLSGLSKLKFSKTKSSIPYSQYGNYFKIAKHIHFL